MRVLRLLKLNEPRSHMVMMTVVFLGIGITLWAQPGRYDNTPSYANLLAVFHQPVWGTIYLIAAALKIACIWRYTNRTLITVTHTVGVTLVSVWLVAFVIRYWTDSGTTIVNVMSWLTYLYLVVRSAMMLDEHVGTKGE